MVRIMDRNEEALTAETGTTIHESMQVGESGHERIWKDVKHNFYFRRGCSCDLERGLHSVVVALSTGLTAPRDAYRALLADVGVVQEAESLLVQFQIIFSGSCHIAT